MVKLDNSDFQQLVGTLQGQQLMQDARSRRQLLAMAGLETVAPQIDLEGAPFVVTANIITFLAQYGRLTYDNEALGLFLNTVKTFVGVDQQETLGGIIDKYGMMVPIAPNQPVKDWQSPTTGMQVVEKVFGENTLRPIAFLARGLETARSVVFIGVNSGGKRWSGTGFMAAPNLVVTNHHVVTSADLLEGVNVKFNYQENFRGEAEPTKVFDAKAGGLFHANQTLDYAVFEVEGAPGAEWGFLPMAPRNITVGERINIIQHPYGQPKQITIQNNFVEFVGGNVLQYVTATNPGSSGSPVLNDSWQVVGLHHAGGNIPEPTTGQFYNRNEGILISKILADLPDAIRQVVDQAAGPAIASG